MSRISMKSNKCCPTWFPNKLDAGRPHWPLSEFGTAPRQAGSNTFNETL